MENNDNGHRPGIKNSQLDFQLIQKTNYTSFKNSLKTKEGLYPTKKMTGKPQQQNVGKRLNKGKYQQCSQVKSKKCIALLLVDVETQVIPHIKAKEEIYSPKNL